MSIAGILLRGDSTVGASDQLFGGASSCLLGRPFSADSFRRPSAGIQPLDPLGAMASRPADYRNRVDCEVVFTG